MIVKHQLWCFDDVSARRGCWHLHGCPAKHQRPEFDNSTRRSNLKTFAACNQALWLNEEDTDGAAVCNQALWLNEEEDGPVIKPLLWLLPLNEEDGAERAAIAWSRYTACACGAAQQVRTFSIRLWQGTVKVCHARRPAILPVAEKKKRGGAVKMEIRGDI